MNLISEQKNVPINTTPVWLKRLLLFLLLASSAAGFILNSSMLQQSTSSLFKTLVKKPAIENKLDGLQAFFEAATPSTTTATTNIILCQGTIISKEKGALAIINGKPAKTGAVINSSRILEISASNVLVECNGKTRRLAPGEYFIPKQP